MTDRLTRLRDLHARVCEASGPSYELEQRIFAFAYGWSFPLFGAAHEEWARLSRETARTNYTYSLDATLALAEKLLPDAEYVIGKGKLRPDESLYGAILRRPGSTVDALAPDLGVGEHDASLALALLAALFAALIAQESADG